jgi:hypothetical protein
MYPVEILGEWQDDGRMIDNKAKLERSVVGHRIVKAETRRVKAYPEYEWSDEDDALVLTLDNGQEVYLRDTSDCCAYTEVRSFLLHPDKIDHVITGVGTTDGYTMWHIYADFGDVLTLDVGWSCGNPFYYGYGFNISVLPVKAAS